MKKLVLISVAMFTLSVCAAGKMGFKSYVEKDFTNMKTNATDTTLDNCVKTRYTSMSNFVSTVLTSNLNNVKTVVKNYCNGKTVEKPYSVETFTYKGTPYNNALVLRTTDVPTKCPATGTTVNNPGDRWFFAKEECSGIDFSL